MIGSALRKAETKPTEQMPAAGADRSCELVEFSASSNDMVDEANLKSVTMLAAE